MSKSNSDVSNNPVVLEILHALQGLEEIGGVKDTTEYIAIMDYLENELYKRSSNARSTLRGKLSDRTREEIVTFLASELFDIKSSVGVIDGEIMDGCYELGLNEMTDEELVGLLLDHTGEEEEVYIRACSELGIESILTSEESDV